MLVIVWKWEYEKENDSGNEKVRKNSELERDFVIVRGIWNFEDENNEGESENKEGKREKGELMKTEEGKGGSREGAEIDRKSVV